ncbi:MAG TPA: DUF1501 domain-containing protein [Candidatus Eisenbacteria bacterium]
MKRRQFMTRMSGILSGTLLGKSVWWPVTREALAGTASNNQRILVMIVLQGGNDGLNTVIPVADPLYYSKRPNLAVPQAQTLGIAPGAALHPQLAPLMDVWNTGRMAIVRDVGYPDMNLSHFRATDIMFSGSSSTSVIQTGWLGRWLEAGNPTFPTILPPDPMALQQGLSAGLLLQGDRGVTGVVVNDPSSFHWLVTSNYNGPFNDATPATRGGSELGFVRSIDRASFEYANAIEAAADAGANHVAYPEGNELADQLSVVARLINGGMGTPVYVTGLDGFDTHAGQLGAHPALLSNLAQASAAFIADLRAMGRFQDVLIMTVSEFGRRPEENGTDGTDHGTAAAWFLISDGIDGGLYGAPPNLADLDDNGNTAMQYDYRSVYSSVLQGWFGTDPALTSTILQGSFPMLPLMTQVGVPEPGGAPRTRLLPPTPNPGRGPRTIRFELARSARGRVSVFDVGGRQVAQVAEGNWPAGSHEVRWDPAGIAPGLYFISLDADGKRQTQKLMQQ